MTESPRRILVVDNDPDVLNSVEFNLDMAGYEALTANSREAAIELLGREIVHLAIVDIRLEREDQPDDLSGFDVARKLPNYNIPCVIFTAYEDKESIRQALGEVGAKAILDKSGSDAASQLIDIVDELFSSEVKVNLNLEIEGDLAPVGVAAQIQVPGSDQATADDVRQVLQTLFHDALGIHITPLLAPEPAPTFTQAGSVLVRAQPRFENARGAPLAVKFSDRDEIMREADNYRLIKPFLGGQRLAVLDREAHSRQIGGLAYSLIGAGDWETIRTFGQVFLEDNTEQVNDLLERFFSQTFGALFADARRETINLTATYTQGLRLTPEKLQTAAKALKLDTLTQAQLRFHGLPDSFKNPIAWALPEGRFRKFQKVSQKCLCHGDLHSQNILVDAAGHFWLIDFGRVAESHALRDFAELETDIKFNLLSTTDLSDLLPFERALLAPAKFKKAPKEDMSFDDNRLNHAYQVILALRRIASDLLDLEDDMCEYYQALFLHTLNIMRLHHIRAEKKEHALLSASLICQRLRD